MATNDFIGFASAGSANVMSQADYAAAVEQGNGVQPGMASSALANKVWRQGANMASALGAFILAQGYDALDDGDLATLTSNLTNALLPASGVWTPVLRGSVIAGDFNYLNQAGIYYKVGQLVYIRAEMSITSCITVPTGDLRITGLPYTSYGTPAGRVMTIWGRGTGFDDESAQKIAGFYVADKSGVLVSRVFVPNAMGILTKEGNWSPSNNADNYIKVSAGSYSSTTISLAGWYLSQ